MSKIQFEVFMSDVQKEIESARKKFPSTHCVSLAMMEEAGELVRAMLGQSDEEIYMESVQTVAMVFRMITEGDPSVAEYRHINNIKSI